MTVLKAPFPWFGGKSRVAHVVWRAFGDVPNFVEPFAGSLAVLLGRPHEPKTETVNDRDCYLANFWRAVKAEPLEVAKWADWPVNEADLHARHKWLVNQTEFRERMHTDPDFYDVKIAGWWVWGICQWIGSGWCTEPDHHKRPSLGGGGGIMGVAAPPCTDWFLALQARLRRVRVLCGDWKRVLRPSVLGARRRPCAVFLDPPYTHELRDARLYAEDDATISTRVREWALAHGDDPDLRIALCGYEGEHEMPSSWTVYAWKASRGYAGDDNNNRERERIWFSPHCLPLEDVQTSLFGRSA